MHTVSSWLLGDPRRLCVIGVWAEIAALAASVLAVVQGDFAVAGLAMLLFLSAAGMKASGLQRFRLHRIRRRHLAAGSGGSAQVA